MRRLITGGAIVVAILALSAPAGYTSTTDTTYCSGTLAGGTYVNVVVPAGATCVLPSTVTVTNDVTVQSGASLLVQGATVTHDLRGNDPLGIGIDGALVGHDLKFDGVTGSAPGFTFNFVCATTVLHDLVLTNGAATAGPWAYGGAGCTSGNTVTHDLSITNNKNGVDFGPLVYGHKLNVKGNAELLEPITQPVTVQVTDSNGAGLAGTYVKYSCDGGPASSFGTTDSSGLAGPLPLPSGSSCTLTASYRGTFDSETLSPVGRTAMVEFQTSAVTVSLDGYNGSPLSGGVVRYKASGILYYLNTSGGRTNSSGEAATQMFDGTWEFLMQFTGSTQSKTATVAGPTSVAFQMSKVTVTLADSGGTPISGGVVTYLAPGTSTSFYLNPSQLSTDTNGQVTGQLLDNTYTVRVTKSGVMYTKIVTVAGTTVIAFTTS